MSLTQIIILLIVSLVILVVIIFLGTGVTSAPYVPTASKDLAKDLGRILSFKKTDLLIDLGAGDGKVLAATSKNGAKALGIELNPIMAFSTKIRYRHDKNIKVLCRNLYRFRFPKETTIVYAFTTAVYITPVYHKVQKEANRLGKTLYFISNAAKPKNIKYQKKIDSFYLYKVIPEKTC
ncbi:class I SAM-dependent methyltransferase [Candidatus Saccharibacteria bacterium]|nr:class I SAM-dependent methyltransferase [Candidatus Saccharibacteria bacterium]